MGDLPPSYEAATAIPADQPFLSAVPPKPSAPYYTTTPTSLQTTVAIRKHRKCLWLTIILIALIVAIIVISVIIGIAHVNKQHKIMMSSLPNYDWDAYNIRNNPLTEYNKSGWDTFNKNHQEFLDRLKNKGYK